MVKGGFVYSNVEEALAVGMAVAYHAARRPDLMAVATRYGERSFGELNARANQFARLLRRHGIGQGDAIAVVTRNRPEFVEAYCAALRAGVRVTPVNWHLTGEESGYVIDNCEAKAVVYDASLGTGTDALVHASGCRLRLAVGGAIPGFDRYDAVIDGESGTDIEDPVRGSQMLYTSGTTGRPKGVYRRQAPVQRGATSAVAPADPDRHVCLCTGPAYHAAPLAFNVTAPLHATINRNLPPGTGPCSGKW